MSALLASAPVFESSTKTVYVVARWVEYVGTALFYGGLAFLTLLWPAGGALRSARRLLCGAWLVGATATVAALDLEAAWARGRSSWGLFDTSSLSELLGTDFGRAWAVMFLLWVLALFVLGAVLRRGAVALRSLPWRVGALAVGLATIRVFGLTGHARETAHPLVGQLADAVHLSAMSVWIGGLTILALVVLPHPRSEDLGAVVRGYSTLALLSVTAAAASGVVLAWGTLGTVGALTSTTYGHILLFKIGVLALVLAAAFRSKTWVEHRLNFAVILRGESGTGIRLIRPFAISVATETALLVLVLAAASVLVTADPGR